MIIYTNAAKFENKKWLSCVFGKLSVKDWEELIF